MGKYDKIKTPRQAWEAASRLRKIRRVPELESIIISDSSASYNYAMRIIQGRWKEAEPNILTGNTKVIFLYAKNIIGNRWPEAEIKIIENKDYIFQYSFHVIKGRWVEAEKSLLEKFKKDFDDKKRLWYRELITYCKAFVKDRWPEAEDLISKDSEALLEYSTNILEDKLPETLHNMMICYSFEDEEKKEISKQYFDFIEKTEATLKKQLKNRFVFENMKVKDLLDALG